MPDAPHCPDADVLRHFLLGRLPPDEVETLGGHVEGCGRCLDALNALHDSDALVEALRTLPAGPEPPPGLVERVQALRTPPPPTRPEGPRGLLAALAEPPAEATKEVYRLLAPPEAPGELGRLGPYRVLRVLGAGGMGVVFEAEDAGLKRRVALKVLRPALAASPEARRRFLREAQAAAALTDDHVVPIYQVGEDGGVPFLTMPLLDGETLEDRLRRAAPLPATELLRVGREIAEGLAAAHERGLIHRDIKPANVWLEARGDGRPARRPDKEASGEPPVATDYRVKILDFGLARGVAEDARLTQPGTLLGTPAYMAPEQARGEEVDARGDLFSLGCVLYYAGTGVQPFRGAHTYGTLTALALHQPPPPHDINPALPRPLSDLIGRLLAKDPADRPPSARAVAEALAALAGERAGHPPGGRQPPDRRRRLRRRLVGGLLAALAVLVVSGWFAPAVVRYATGKGELVIETDDPDIEVVVKRDNVTLVDRSKGRTFELAAGAGEVEVYEAASGLRLLTRKFTLQRGGRERVNVRAELARAGQPAPPGAPGGPAPADALRREDIPADQLAVAGDGDPGRAPAELVAVLGDGRLRHWDQVNAVCFSPDGHLLATASYDHTVRLWDTATGRLVRTLTGHQDKANYLTFDAAGKLLASSGFDGTVRLWDTATGELRHTLRHRDLVGQVAFLAGGDVLASASYDGTVKLWDAATGEERATLTGHEGRAHGVAASPDGQMLATSGFDGTVKLWHVPTRTVRWSVPARQGIVWHVYFSPDGKLVASFGDDSTVKLWHVATGQPLPTEAGPRQGDWGAPFRPDGRMLATAGDGGTVRLWDTQTWQQVGTLRGHTARVWSVAFRPDGRVLASGSGDGVVKLWDTATGKELLPRTGHQSFINALAISPDGGLLASGSWDHTIKLWDLATGQERRTLTGHQAPVNSLAFDRGGRLLASGSDDTTVKVWETSAWRSRTLMGHRGNVRSVAFSPDGTVLASAGAADRTIKLWDPVTGQEQRQFLGHLAHVNAVAFRADGRVLASGSPDRTVKLWDPATGLELRTLTGHDSWVESVAFRGASGVLASASDDRTVRLWDTDTGQVLHTLKGHSDHVHFVAFSPDGRRLASAGFDGTVRLWDPATGTPLQVLALGPPGGRIWRLAFSPDGRHLATVNGNGTVYVLRLAPPSGR